MEKQDSDLQVSKDSQKSSPSVDMGMAKVFVFSCPYLGTPDDEDTSLAYPAAANHCFRYNSPAAIEFSHQEAYCLSDQHSSCHIFQMSNADNSDLGPAEVHNARSKKSKRRLSLYALPIILVLILLAAIIWWPAPGTTIQESLVRGAQNDREISGGATLTGKPVSQPQETGSAAEAPSEPATESVTTAPNLNDSGENEVINGGAEDSNTKDGNEDAGTFERDSASNSEISIPSDQPEEVPQVAEPGVSSPDPAAPIIDETAESEGSSEATEDVSEVTEDVSEVTEDVNEEQTTPVDVFEDSAGASNAQEAAASAVEEIAAGEKDAESDLSAESDDVVDDESTSIVTADLPVISTDTPMVTSTAENIVAVNDSSPSVIMVGPTSSTALSLSGASEEISYLPVYQGPAGEGGQLSVIEERQFATLLARDGSGQWLNIRLANGIEGWINANQSGSNLGGASLSAAAAAPATLAATSYPIIRQAYVDTGALNFRSGPGIEYAPISILNQGQLVGLIGRQAFGPWVRVRLDSGAEGWVNSSLLAPIS